MNTKNMEEKNLENLLYNYGGVDSWEKATTDDDSQQLCLYEAHHGKYVGDIVGDEIFYYKTGEYLGEIRNGRLIVDKSKKGVRKIDKKPFGIRFSRSGRVFVPKQSKMEIPSDYEEFTIQGHK